MRSILGMYLGPEQQRLLQMLVEIDRAATAREPFMFVVTMGSMGTVQHSAHQGSVDAYAGDMRALETHGLILFWEPQSGVPGGLFDVTGAGLVYYEELMRDGERQPSTGDNVVK